MPPPTAVEPEGGALRPPPTGSRRGRDLTRGSPLKNILYMGVPSMIGFATTTLYSLTDIFWLGRLGTNEVAAVTLFAAVVWILYTANNVVGTGSVAVISRRFGEADIEATEHAIRQTIILKFVLGALFALLGIATLEPVLRLMNARGPVLELGLVYGRLYYLGLPLLFSSYTFYTALRGVGDAPRAMRLMLMATALNIVLDPLFIFVLGWGVAGAAVATVLAGTTACAAGFWTLLSGRTNIRVRWPRRPEFDWPIMKRILDIGLPAAVGELARSTFFGVVAGLVARFGTVMVASYGIAFRVIELGITFAVGLSLGTSAIVGQTLGAGRPEQARRSVRAAGLLALAIGCALALVEVLAAPEIVRVFSPDPDVRSQGVSVLRYLVCLQPLFSIAIVFSAAFYGAGNTWPPSVIAVLTMWGVRLPFIAALILFLDAGPWAIWWGLLVGGVLESSLVIRWVARGAWLERRV